MIILGAEISTIGGWSTIYRIHDDDNLCAKVLAPHRKYRGEFPDPAMIARNKYGIADMLEYEFNNYSRIMSLVPEHLKKYFVSIHGIDVTDDNRKALVMELVKDENGSVANNLSTYQKHFSLDFFKALEQLRREFFIPLAIDHFGIACRNILVKSPSQPVLIDFQNSIQRMRGQFWLKIPFFVKRKMTRKFQRVYSDLNVKDFSACISLNDISFD